MIVLAMLTAVSFTSCDSEEMEDIDQAYDMNGIWQGTINGNYYYDRYASTNNDWDTEIQFVQEGNFANGGYGIEVDYSRNSHRISRSSFTWEVRHGKILLDYEDGYRVIIRDYELYSVGSGMRFRGYFDDYYNGDELASFNLVKVSDWTDYSKQHKADFSDIEEE